ncbi:hypothetical protein VNO78_26243 [Psophocarpus tetragonolobus]|uniref:Uncharacterized protein n=1 Tax=Psophocarpus tetragonolobus TaxID=3891 RepID=A0AAN9X8S1_PSOTE
MDVAPLQSRKQHPTFPFCPYRLIKTTFVSSSFINFTSLFFHSAPTININQPSQFPSTFLPLFSLSLSHSLRRVKVRPNSESAFNFRFDFLLRSLRARA